MDQNRLISLIVPVFNESEVIGAFYERASAALRGLRSFDHEIIFIDDGSRDDSLEKLVRLADGDPHVRVVKFSRNFGHQLAITAGIDVARGDAVVIIDSDLQDPPELIPKLIEQWDAGFDVVYAKREKREGETKLKLLTATLFYRLLKSLVKTDIPTDVGDFRLMSARAVKHFRQLREQDRFVRGLVSWIGFKQTGVLYERDKRYAGETKYPFRKMLKFAFDGLTSFSTVPLKLATWLGYCSSVFAFIYLCYVLLQWTFGNTVQGWATSMVAVLFVGGVQLICLGIVGEYIGRIFTEIKKRPLYIIEDIYEKSNGESAKVDLARERELQSSSK